MGFDFDQVGRLPAPDDNVAIATRRLEAGTRVSYGDGEFGVPHVFADWRELLGRGDVHAVHNCTPNNLHFEVNRALQVTGLDKHLAVHDSVDSALGAPVA